MSKKIRHYKLDQVSVTDISSEGKGIAKIDGKVLFIDKAITGDVIHLQSKKTNRSYEYASILDIREKSPLRKEEHCIHHEKCGGCKMQHLAYSSQLEWKSKVVKDAMERIGGFQDLDIMPIIGCEETEGYRNKLDYAVSNKRWLTTEEVRSELEINRNGIGFHLTGMFDKVVDIKECHHMPEINNLIRNYIREKSAELEISYYDILGKNGCLRNILIRRNVKNEWMICFQIFEMHDQFLSLLEALKLKFPELISIQYTINTKVNDAIYDLKFELYHGQDFITEYLGTKKFKITPKSFFQTNTNQCVRLYNLVGEMAKIGTGDIVYDLYCGVGSIGIYLADIAKKIVGIEVVDEAIKDARMNAKMNDMENCEYFSADIKDIFTEEFIHKAGKPDIIITDPPRAGMHPDVVTQLRNSGCPKIVYVSCNPQTMANDLKELSQAYKIEKIQPVDMFPHTIHIETIALLVKK